MTKQSIRPTTLPIGWLVIGLIAIAGIGLWQNHELNQTPTPSPTAIPSNWQKVTDTRAMFSTAVLIARNKTFVLIPIRFENKVETTWLDYDSSASAEPNQLLITHPALLDLNWNRIDKGAVHLYQKNPVYKSMEAFLARPPEKSKLLMDNGLFQILPYSKLDATELTDQPDMQKTEFILTTYVPLTKKNDAYYYENIIDASNATISNNKMAWKVFAPNASPTNPYYLGEIHIDYRR